MIYIIDNRLSLYFDDKKLSVFLLKEQPEKWKKIGRDGISMKAQFNANCQLHVQS